MCHVRPPGYRPVAAGDPPVGELVLHEEDVGLQDVDVVEVVADRARQRRLPDLLQLRERQRAAGVRVLAVLVPKPVQNDSRGCNKGFLQFTLNKMSLHRCGQVTPSFLASTITLPQDPFIKPKKHVEPLSIVA